MKISVCIPTYNQSQYLRVAIDSVLQQTLVPDEIIVSNDCSTDETVQVLGELSQKISFLKVINQPQNLGIAKNTDSCLRAATGDFIVRLDSDDYLDKPFCEKLSQLLIQHPKAGFAHGNVTEINQFGEVIGKRNLFRKETFYSAKEALKAASKGYRVAANIIMFRKAALEQVNYTTGRPNYVEDYHLSSDLAAHGWGNAYYDAFLSFYRVWIDTAKVRQRRKMMEIVGLYRVFTEVLEPAYIRFNLNAQSLKSARERLACNQSDCLGWDVYSKEEKEELKEAILKLSNSGKTRLYTKIYLNGHGKVIDAYNSLLGKLRSFLKALRS